MIIPKGADVVRIGEYEGFIPKSWNDLPTPILLNITAELMAAGFEAAITPSESTTYRRLCVLGALINCTPKNLLYILGLGDGEDSLKGERRKEVTADLDTLLQQITFCFEEVKSEEEDGPTLYRLNPTLTRNPYRKIHDLYGPPNGLKGISIYELAMILTRMDAYTASKDPKDLHLLMATIYRPRILRSARTMSGKVGDLRQKLYQNDDHIELRAKRWRKCPPLVLQLILFYLQSCRQAIVKTPAFAILFEQSSGGKEDPHGWAGTLLHLANNQVMNMDRAAVVPYESALLQLAREKAQAQEDERLRNHIHPIA